MNAAPRHQMFNPPAANINLPSTPPGSRPMPNGAHLNGNDDEDIQSALERARVAKRDSIAAGKEKPPFIQKLTSFLNQNTHPELIRWSPDGNSFIVVDEVGFAKTLIPEMFKHNNYASFVRQLNMYGFHKKVGLTDNSLSASVRKNKTPSVYQHPYFKRDYPDLLWLVTKSAKKRKRPDGLPEFAGESSADMVTSRIIPPPIIPSPITEPERLPASPVVNKASATSAADGNEVALYNSQNLHETITQMAAMMARLVHDNAHMKNTINQLIRSEESRNQNTRQLAGTMDNVVKFLRSAFQHSLEDGPPGSPQLEFDPRVKMASLFNKKQPKLLPAPTSVTPVTPVTPVTSVASATSATSATSTTSATTATAITTTTPAPTSSATSLSQSPPSSLSQSMMRSPSSMAQELPLHLATAAGQNSTSYLSPPTTLSTSRKSFRKLMDGDDSVLLQDDVALSAVNRLSNPPATQLASLDESLSTQASNLDSLDRLFASAAANNNMSPQLSDGNIMSSITNLEDLFDMNAIADIDSERLSLSPPNFLSRERMAGFGDSSTTGAALTANGANVMAFGPGSHGSSRPGTSSGLVTADDSFSPSLYMGPSNRVAHEIVPNYNHPQINHAGNGLGPVDLEGISLLQAYTAAHPSPPGAPSVATNGVTATDSVGACDPPSLCDTEEVHRDDLSLGGTRTPPERDLKRRRI